MNEINESLIKFSVEGLDSENGHLRLDEVLEQLEHLLATLNGIDRIVGNSGRPLLYYRIKAVSHSSPLRFTLEPVVRLKVRSPHPNHVKATHHRFFRELEAIRSMSPVSPEIDDDVLEHLRDLVSGLGKTFKSGNISNDCANIELDEKFEGSIRQLLNEELCSYGGIEGTLDALNIHGSARRFWIYPKIGPERVRCDFLPGTREQIREAAGQYVRVEGVKYFRPPNPYPVRVQVRQFEIITKDDAVDLYRIGGIAPGATQLMDSVEFVRTIRDEWDQ